MADDLRRGAVFAVAAAAAMAVGATCVKGASATVPSTMIVFFRALFGLMLMLPWLIRGGRQAWRTQRIDGHIWRSAFGIVSMYGYFHALSHLPLAEAVLLTYTMPLFAPFIGWLWLGERPPNSALPAALIGLAGIALIVKPGTTELTSSAALIGALSGVSAAAAMIGIRRISNTEPASRIVFYFLLMSTVITATPLHWTWQTPTAPAWLWLLGVGAFATGGQLLLTRAYGSAPAAFIGPFTYTAVIFAGALGWALWGETPDLWSLAGIALVIGSCLLTLLPGRGRRRVDAPTEV
ncbi:EamA family transporter [uncultured Nevskia sp.]|uniref:DMT family transporter n=1 Tax=uncultured Nevskia sp. TaxID=228950 RepID=UPI0025CD9E59|nr:EamA family transporter [uncultured Nevskia sp.]